LTIASIMDGWSDPRLKDVSQHASSNGLQMQRAYLTKQWVTPACILLGSNNTSGALPTSHRASKKANEAVY
jgi:hypothetical protein